MNIKLANRLVELRKEHKFSQEALAEKLGLSRQSISKWERAEASPDTDNLIALAEVYGITLDQLLGNEETTDTTTEASTETVEEKNELSENQLKGKKRLLKAPLFFLGAVALYVGGGIVLGVFWWLIMWTLFPLVFAYAFKGLSMYYENKKGLSILFSTLSLILLTVVLYIIFGIAFQLWAIAWVVFLAIPAHIYISVVKK